MIGVRSETAPEALGRRPANRGWFGRQPSSVALCGRLRARGGQGPIASPRHTSRRRVPPVRWVSYDANHFDRHDANSVARLTVDEVATNLATFANSVVFSRSGRACVEATNLATFVERDNGVRLRGGEGGGYQLVHGGNSVSIDANIGPLALDVNSYFPAPEKQAEQPGLQYQRSAS